jgi:hypothetical protein
LGIFFLAVSGNVQHKIHNPVAPKVVLKSLVRKLNGELD